MAFSFSPCCDWIFFPPLQLLRWSFWKRTQILWWVSATHCLRCFTGFPMQREPLQAASQSSDSHCSFPALRVNRPRVLPVSSVDFPHFALYHCNFAVLSQPLSLSQQTMFLCLLPLHPLEEILLDGRGYNAWWLCVLCSQCLTQHPLCKKLLFVNYVFFFLF